jgi:demethylmenaquinone methyltransferase/2-methoxy-6-polyprenyl-1,4-benzoquinol methylase
VFAWRPERRYDTVFFALWLSHVPASRFGEFWETVAAALAPHGRAVFVDEGTGPALEGVTWEIRGLDDGREYRILKIYHEPPALTGELAALGWSAEVRPLGDFIVGVAEPPPRR